MEWNAGGWFGSQLGSSIWILVAAGLSVVRDVSTGVVLFAIFAVPNIAGYFLWRSKKLSCYAATQTLIGLMGIGSLLAIYVLDRGGLWREIQSGSSISAQSGYFVVGAVFAILMLMFYVRFARGSDDSAN